MNIEKLRDARPALPEGLNDRAADYWEPPLAIAELAGGDWPMKARAAATRLSGDSEAAAESTGVQLLRAIKVVFETLGVDRIASENLAEELAKEKDSPWAAYGKTGKPSLRRGDRGQQVHNRCPLCQRCLARRRSRLRHRRADADRLLPMRN